MKFFHFFCKLRPKFCPSDPVPTILLKDCAPTFAPIIYQIVNLSAGHATVPSVLKTPLIRLLLKKPSLAQSWRHAWFSNVYVQPNHQHLQISSLSIAQYRLYIYLILQQRNSFIHSFPHALILATAYSITYQIYILHDYNKAPKRSSAHCFFDKQTQSHITPILQNLHWLHVKERIIEHLEPIIVKEHFITEPLHHITNCHWKSVVLLQSNLLKPVCKNIFNVIYPWFFV